MHQRLVAASFILRCKFLLIVTSQAWKKKRIHEVQDVKAMLTVQVDIHSSSQDGQAWETTWITQTKVKPSCSHFASFIEEIRITTVQLVRCSLAIVQLFF